jgi:hypothetical protein
MAESYNFNIANPYQQQQEELSRRQKMAEILQQQSFQPMERTSYAGIEAPISPYAGLAKMLQAYTGAKGQQKVAEERIALGEKYQTDLMDTLTKASELQTGRPAMPAQAPVTRVDDEGNIMPGVPAMPAVMPNLQAAAQEYMKHPATQPLGMQQMQRNAQTQAFINAGNAGNVPAAPVAAPTAAPGAMPSMPVAAPAAAPTAQPTAAALSRFGGPAGGQPMSVWMQLDPTGGKYTEQLAKDYTEQNKPTDKQRELIAAGVKPGSDAWNFALTDTATQGGIWRRGSDGALSLAPGYAAGQGSVTSATEEAKAKFDFIDVPITQPDGTTIIKKMSKAEYAKISGGNAPQQAGGPLNLTAPTDAAAVQMGRELDRNGQPFNITVPRAGAPSGFGVSNPVQQEAQKAAATGSVKAITDKLESSFASAQSSEERMRTVQSIKPILDLPLITGPGATPQMFLSQVANKMYGVSNEETLANTRQLITGLSELSLSSRGALKGQGTITEGEGALLVKAKSAPESLTVPEYKRLFTLFEKQDKRAIEQHEDIRKRAEKAGIPNIDFWRVETPNAQTGQQLRLSPAAQDAVDRAMGRKP